MSEPTSRRRALFKRASQTSYRMTILSEPPMPTYLRRLTTFPYPLAPGSHQPGVASRQEGATILTIET